jgi:glycine cleavage system H protein
MMNIPTDLIYTKDHEWAKIKGDIATVGITEFAVGQLGDITLVELPEKGEAVTAGEPMGTVESVKAVSDLFSPLSGEIVEINEALEEAPELVNEDPFDRGWMVKIALSDESEKEDLLGPSAYRAHCDEEEDH